MRALLIGSLLLLATVPNAAAQACPADLQDTVCTYAAEFGFEDVFGEWGWIVMLVLGFFVVIALINLIVWLVGPKASPRFSVTPREQVREVGPGGSVQLIMDVENRRRKTSVDLAVNMPDLPPGWGASPFAAVAHASGWTTPIAITDETPLHLTSLQKGAHKAALAIQLTAPSDVFAEETLDVPIRVAPLNTGVPGPGRGVNVRYSVLLTTRRPVLQISNVVHDPERIAAGRPVVTRATVQNAGEVEARDVAVSFMLNEQPVDKKSVPIVPAKGEAAVEFIWTASSGENKIRISAA